MSYVIALDPGIRGCGLSIGSTVSNVMLSCSYIKNPEPRGNDLPQVLAMAGALIRQVRACGLPEGEVAYLAVEWPQVYAGQQRGKKDPNDLLPLTAVIGAFAGLLDYRGNLRASKRYLPREWKGTINADEMIRRIKERITAPEWRGVEFTDNACEVCRMRLSISVCAKSTCMMHNAFDSAGILLKYFGRLEKFRAIHR